MPRWSSFHEQQVLADSCRYDISISPACDSIDQDFLFLGALLHTGFYQPFPGSQMFYICPSFTFSNAGATGCMPCKDAYGPGAARCSSGCLFLSLCLFQSDRSYGCAQVLEILAIVMQANISTENRARLFLQVKFCVIVSILFLFSV